MQGRLKCSWKLIQFLLNLPFNLNRKMSLTQEQCHHLPNHMMNQNFYKIRLKGGIKGVEVCQDNQENQMCSLSGSLTHPILFFFKLFSDLRYFCAKTGIIWKLFIFLVTLCINSHEHVLCFHVFRTCFCFFLLQLFMFF